MTPFERYAVYFVPEENDDILTLADAWFGRCTLTGTSKIPPLFSGFPQNRIEAITERPSRYGFHATLKAPFRPAQGVGLKEIARAVEKLADGLPVGPRLKLKLDVLDDFLALRPIGDDSAIHAVANACVTRLDHLRAPMTAEEYQHRTKSPMSEQQKSFLHSWGYPHVLAQFRFHMSLTRRLHPVEISPLFNVLDSYFRDALLRPLRMKNLTIVGDRGEGLPFEVLERIPPGNAQKHIQDNVVQLAGVC